MESAVSSGDQGWAACPEAMRDVTGEQHCPATASWERGNLDVLYAGQVRSHVASGAWFCLIKGCLSH